MAIVCNEDCTKCKYLNIKLCNRNYWTRHYCMKYKDTVLEKDFLNRKILSVFLGGGSGER